MQFLEWIIKNAEKIGVVAILIIVVWGLLYVIRLLWQQKNECESSRLTDAKERSEIYKKMGNLEEKVKTINLLQDKIKTLEELNQQVLINTIKEIKNANNK